MTSKRFIARLAFITAALCTFGLSLSTADDHGPKSPLTAEFYRLARIDFEHGDELRNAVYYLFKLPEQERIIVARSLIKDKDPRINVYGLNTLTLLNKEDETIPGFASLLASGDDLTSSGYAWFHMSEDRDLPLRMYIKIGRYLIKHWSDYGSEQRKPMVEFLSDGGLGAKFQLKTEFSLEAAKNRLKEVEKFLSKPIDQ